MIKINDTRFAVFIMFFSIIYQIACVIQGFDLTDEGHLMILYRYFGEDPQLSQCASGYPLTCYLGWLLHSVYPQGGLLMMRLWGVFFVSLVEVVAYLFLCRVFGDKKWILYGLLLQTIFVAGDPKPFGYNTLSGLCAILIVINLNYGCKINKWRYSLIGGFLIGVSPFIRIPNISFIMLLCIPFVYWFFDKYKYKYSIKYACSKFLVGVVGFLIGIVFTWECMCLIGADNLIYDFIYSITGQLEGDSTHNFQTMLYRYFYNYVSAVFFFIFYVVCFYILSTGWIMKKYIWCIVCTVVFFIFHWVIYVSSPLLGEHFLYLYNGIGLFGALYYVVVYKPYKTEVAISAVCISVLLPLGSDLGFATMWVGTILSLPIGMCALKEYIQNIDTSIYYYCTFIVRKHESGEEKKRIIKIQTPRNRQPFYALLAISIFLLADTVLKIERRAYYDVSSRFQKIASIDSPMSKGVYTQNYKARVINSTLREFTKYVSPGDVALIYDFSPMMYYLTETKPWAGVAWPCVYYGKPYVRRFDKAIQEADSLPVVLIQHFYSSNNWMKVDGNKDVNNYMKNKSLENEDQSVMNECVTNFLKLNNYKSVWYNGFYEILVPENKYVINRTKAMSNNINKPH